MPLPVIDDVLRLLQHMPLSCVLEKHHVLSEPFQAVEHRDTVPGNGIHVARWIVKGVLTLSKKKKGEFSK